MSTLSLAPSYYVSLSDLAAATAERVGRKALSLAEMLQAGLPVPPAAAVTTEAYRAATTSPEVAQALAEAGRLPTPEAFERVRSALEQAPLPEALVGAIVEAYHLAGGGRVAVRSSGTAEDLAGASFAGMYESYLHVSGEQAVVAAVRRCWASAWSERVAAYMAKKGIARAEHAMGVVIQRMVESEVAGVMFTLDPLTGLEDHMRVEACFGLGEALVSGRVQPDRFVISRADGAALETAIATQEFRIVGGPEGVLEEPLSPEEGALTTLTPAQLGELARLGRKVQAHYGAPQDLEWAIAEGRIWLVQARPVTTIAYAGVDGEWTTADFKDGGVSARVCSPYMWSLYDSIWQVSMPSYLRMIQLLRHDEPVLWGRVFYGRPYWNVGEVKRCLHLVPGFNERNFDRDLGIEGSYAGDGVVIPTNAATIARALPVLLALTADYQARLLANKVFVGRFEGIASQYAEDPAGLPRETLAARYRRLLRDDYFLTESSYFYTIYNTSNAKLDFKVELDKLNAELDEPLSYLKLLSGLQGLKHLDPLRDLWAIAASVRENPGLRQLIEATPASELKEAILSSEHARFWATMATFLHRYRHHSVAELDITQPRWDEDPTFVLATLKSYVVGYHPDKDPVAANERQHTLYLDERRRAEAAFRKKGLFAVLDAQGFFSKLDLLRSYSWWREEMRDRSSRMYALIRRETLAVARMLSREGVLEKAQDIWYLKFPEVIALLEGRLDAPSARQHVASRREYNEGFRNFSNPNELGRRFAIGHRPEPAPGALTGIPCSPGVVTARARVVPTIQDAHSLEADEVLVTKFTDPGWTPLFSTIAGVVTETGGILSHAAVIAREYGIPAVLAVPEATRRIKTGDWIVVDGNAGTIEILDGPPQDRPKSKVQGPKSTEPGTLELTIPKAEPQGTLDLGPSTLDKAAPATESLPRPSRYHEFAKPELSRLMRALGLDLTYIRAEGDWMTYEHQGRAHTVLDLLGGYGACLFGHHHPVLVETLKQALEERAPVQAQASCRAWAGELAAALSERIGRYTGRSYVVTLANSGAEAVEAALKHAELERFEDTQEALRRFRRRAVSLVADAGADQSAFLREVARELGVPAGLTLAEALEAIAQANARAYETQPVFFALERAFHGKTSGALQITYHPAYREPFARIGVKCEFLPAGEPEAWQRAVGRASVRTWQVEQQDGRLILVEKPWVNVSAILVEPLQGEGGIHPLTPADAAQLRAIADSHGIPLVVDEIQAGLGRTGEFLASSACGLRGDYYTFAKSLGGGLTKVAAMAVDRERYRPDFGVVHSSTFAEDDLSSRVALRALALLDEERVPQRAARLGEHFLSRLEPLVARYPSVLKAVRGRGLMLGLEFHPQEQNASNVIRMLSDHGYLGYVLSGYLLHEEGFRVAPTMSQTTVMRLEPSAFIAPEELDRFVVALERLCCILERGNAYRLTRYVVGLAQRGDESPIDDFRRPARPLLREAPRCEKRVAFIGHFIAAKDAVLWDPSLALLPEGALERFQLATHRIFGPTIYDQVHVTSAIGETVHLSFIGINLTSKSIEAAMRARDTDWIIKQVEEGVAKAREAGCQVVGLGGYTSIVTDNGRKLPECGVTITTGNSLTVGMGLAALVRGAAEKGLALEGATLGVLGATGNIGSVYARMMARRVARVVLIGREAGSRLARTAAGLYEDAFASLEAGEAPAGIAAAIAPTRAVARLLLRPDRPQKLGEHLMEAIAQELGDAAPVVLTTDVARLRECRLILGSSNSAKPLITPEVLPDGPVVLCDISVPADVADSVLSERPDALVIMGGLVAVPNAPEYRIGGIPLPDGHAFACMSETLLLGLMGVREHFSYGPVQPAKVRQAMAWAEINGFTLGSYKTDRSY